MIFMKPNRKDSLEADVPLVGSAKQVSILDRIVGL